jgi:cysteinyl-tRNA synthetase
MALILYNTLGRKKQVFKPLRSHMVRLYTCGPTVYKTPHIGNYRAYLFEDILKRVLILNAYTVNHVMNITDVGHLESDSDEGEDKIEKAARVEHKNAYDIARFYETEFKKDLKLLHILPPTKYVRATEHIKEQIKLIRTLEKKGFTYTTSDGVYFDTSRLKDYGKLAKKNIVGIRAGARVARGEKRNTTDFVLWKFSPQGGRRQMEWASPWGIGFPGWHIECSALSMKYLGSTLDIHCGGIDHIQIHHSNEIAQSEAATGKPFSRFWMHGAFLTVRGEKMAKSSPETNITMEALRGRGFDPLDFRYLTLGTHYRKPLSFSWEALAGARRARLKVVDACATLPARSSKIDSSFQKKLADALNDDLNTPRALAIFLEWVKKGGSKKLIVQADKIFGLAIKKTSTAKHAQNIPEAILELSRRRKASRAAKNWAEADTYREKIRAHGYTIEDTEQGPAIHKM